MISEERKAELQELWWDETNEDWTQEWRDELTKEEQALINQWDEQYGAGSLRMCQEILQQDD